MRVPRIPCSDCVRSENGGVKRVSVPWARSIKAGFTLSFEHEARALPFLGVKRQEGGKRAGADTIKTFHQDFVEHGGKPEQVEVVCYDVS